MEITDREWGLLMDKFDSIDEQFGKMRKELKKLNGIRIWKAKVTGALTVISVVLIPVAITIVKMWIVK